MSANEIEMPEYPTDDQVEEFLRSSVAPPAMRRFRKLAEANGMPMRKVVGVLIEGAAADSFIAEALADGRL